MKTNMSLKKDETWRRLLTEKENKQRAADRETNPEMVISLSRMQEVKGRADVEDDSSKPRAIHSEVFLHEPILSEEDSN